VICTAPMEDWIEDKVAGPETWAEILSACQALLDLRAIKSGFRYLIALQSAPLVKKNLCKFHNFILQLNAGLPLAMSRGQR
jgi:hypothetical protein